MASVFRKPGSPYWFAAFRDALGRRAQRTTKATGRTAAQRIALGFEHAAKQGRDGVLTESACRKVLSDLHEQTTGKPIAFYSIEGWFNEWLSNRAGTTAVRTMERYTATCRALLKALDERAKLSLGALTPSDLRKYRDALRKEGHSVSTCNQTLKILSAPLENARRLGLIAVNPAQGVNALKNSDKAARGAFTVEQIGALLRAAKDTNWEGCILLGAYCGLRLRDAADLIWESIDLEGGMLTLQTSKTEARVTVPLHPRLRAWLLDRTRGIGKAPVLPQLHGKSGGGKSGLSMAFKRLMTKAGIVGQIVRKGEGAGRTTSTLSFHSTRHFFVSELSAAGVPADIRQRLAGHADAKTHEGYARHELKSSRAAIAKLPSSQ